MSWLLVEHPPRYKTVNDGGATPLSAFWWREISDETGCPLALMTPVTLVGSAIPLVRDRVIHLGGGSVVGCGEASLLVRRNGIRA